MSRKNPIVTTPQFVLDFQAILEKKLGRPASIRQVKNGENWWITDPLFSFVQRGLQKGETGYRIGFYYSLEDDDLAFYLVHSKLVAKIFKSNTRFEILIGALKRTQYFRNSEFLYWSSRVAQKSLENGDEDITIFDVDSFTSFSRQLRAFDKQYDFAKDLFPPAISKFGKKPTWRGNDFYALLAENCSKLSKKKITELLEASWELFCCLYPREPLEKRDASLARSLRSAKIARECEYKRIQNIPSARIIAKKCVGEIQGAHIKPHAFGGSDKALNGLWLCQLHHRATEGKLQGTRENVEFFIK
ncbi:MAG: hypothetical protein RLZZ156_2023 [Deinococcota bacterium]|jgi:hypothetical protein